MLRYLLIILQMLLLLCSRVEGSSFSTRRVLEEAKAPDYYDQLRNLTGVFVNSDLSRSSIFRVTTGNAATYRLAEVKTFLPFSNGTHLRPGVFDDAFTALLAMHHFNNIGTSPILNNKDFQNCNVRMTMELLDTQFSPIETTRTFTGILQRPNPTLPDPPVAAVVGAYRSAVTSPLAILTGVNNIPQVSYASTAVDFNVKEQFPMFGRTITSSVGEAATALRYFQEMGSTHVAVLFVTDAFGSALQKSFQDAASTAGIETESVAFSFNVDAKGASSAMEDLKGTQYRHVYAIFYENHLEPLMEAAKEKGLLGPEYVFLFPGLDLSSLQQNSRVLADSTLAMALNGAGLIQMQGGVTSKPVLSSNSEYIDQAMEDDTSGFAIFNKLVDEALADAEFKNYVQSKIPSSLDDIDGFNRSSLQLTPDPVDMRPFLYDAVVGLGLSMCRAGEGEGKEESLFFSGPEIYGNFSQLDMEGASGRVLINNETGTRYYETIAFVLWNVRTLDDTDEDGYVQLEFVPSNKFENATWKRNGDHLFQYADGSTVPPDPLPPQENDFNFIGDSARIAGYTLMSLTMASSLIALLWLFIYRHERVVRAAQPLFLFLVSIGAIVMSSTIIPLSMEETTTESIAGLDAACMVSPWLYIIGILIATSGMYAKIVGVHQAYMNPDLDFIQVTSSDIFGVFLILLLVNLVVLISWTVVSPLEWTRVNQSATDVFNRITDSYGVCTSDKAVAFAVVLIVMNLSFLVLANWGAYRARNIETEYNESRYIGISMAAILQAWCMGIPILIVVWNNPQGRFYVQAGIIFVTAQALVSLMYVPKMLALRQAQKRENEALDPKRQAYAIYQQRKSSSMHFDCDADSNQLAASGDMLDSPLPMIGEAVAPVLEVENPQDASPVDNEDSMEGIAGNLGQGSIVHNGDGDIDETSRQEATDTPGTQANIPNESSSSVNRRERWHLFLGGAKSSKSVDSSDGGIKVLHNPRSARNLEMAAGREMSRQQLDYFRESQGDDDIDTPVQRYRESVNSIPEVDGEDDEDDSAPEPSLKQSHRS